MLGLTWYVLTSCPLRDAVCRANRIILIYSSATVHRRHGCPRASRHARESVHIRSAAVCTFPGRDTDYHVELTVTFTHRSRCLASFRLLGLYAQLNRFVNRPADVLQVSRSKTSESDKGRRCGGGDGVSRTRQGRPLGDQVVRTFRRCPRSRCPCTELCRGNSPDTSSSREYTVRRTNDWAPASCQAGRALRLVLTWYVLALRDAVHRTHRIVLVYSSGRPATHGATSSRVAEKRPSRRKGNADSGQDGSRRLAGRSHMPGGDQLEGGTCERCRLPSS